MAHQSSLDRAKQALPCFVAGPAALAQYVIVAIIQVIAMSGNSRDFRFILDYGAIRC